MHKNDHSCAPNGLRAARLRLALLRSGLGNERGSVEQKKQDDNHELDFHFHPITPALLDLESRI
jgi:hypothetical protein